MALDHLLYALRQEEVIQHLKDKHGLVAIPCQCGISNCSAISAMTLQR